MRVERRGPTGFRLTLAAPELSALMAAARWAAQGGGGEMPAAARRQLDQLLARYEEAIADPASGVP